MVRVLGRAICMEYIWVKSYGYFSSPVNLQFRKTYWQAAVVIVRYLENVQKVTAAVPKGVNWKE